MKFLIVNLLILAVAYTENSKEWQTYKMEHNKKYYTHEDLHRKNTLMKNKKKVGEHNAKHEKGEISYKVNVNHLSDMEPEEVSAKLNGFRKGLNPLGGAVQTKLWTPPNDINVPAHKDWRIDGAVTSVKDQGGCGSCWAFSSSGCLEGHTFLKTGELIDLSPQNLLDCTWNNYGCFGGFVNNAFQYVIDKGIKIDSYYPYTTNKGKCNSSPLFIGSTCSEIMNISSGNEEHLKLAVGGVGPVSVAIDASNWSFMHYSGGIYDEPACRSDVLDHAVLIVGYGREDDQDYWLVKNSWGVIWGENGYIRMSRNKNNQCGIANTASFPIV